MNNEFKQKYLKYKLKYNKLKQMGGNLFNWPNDLHNIVGKYHSGKKYILIKSISGDMQTHNKLGISNNINIPGLTGFIKEVDNNNLIVANLTDNNGNILIMDDISFNKDNVKEVKFEFVDKMPIRVGSRPTRLPSSVLSKQVSSDGNHILTWPFEWNDIAGPVANGKKIVEIKSMTTNGHTSEKLGIDETIPGLTGIIEKVDENNLIIVNLKNLKNKDGNVILDIVPFDLENVGEVHLEFVNKIQAKLYNHHREIPILKKPTNSQDQHFDQSFDQIQRPSVINPAAPNATNIIYSDTDDTIQPSPTDLLDKATIDAKSTSKLMHMGRPIPMYYGMPMTCCIPMICGMGVYGMGSYSMGSYGMGSHNMGLDPLKLSKVPDIKDIDDKEILIKFLMDEKDNKKILELSEKIKKLESEFKNHHHDIPTSGVRKFDNEEHPYFKNP